MKQQSLYVAEKIQFWLKLQVLLATTPTLRTLLMPFEFLPNQSENECIEKKTQEVVLSILKGYVIDLDHSNLSRVGKDCRVLVGSSLGR